MDRSDKRPPRLPYWLVTQFISPELRERVLGDFEEMYVAMLAERGETEARFALYREAFRSIPRFLFDRLYWWLVLVRSQLRVGFRQLRRQSSYTAINLSGLSVGMTSCLLILLFVLNERSYDRSIPDGDRIYRVAMERRGEPEDLRTAATPRPVAATMAAAFPEIEDATRLSLERTEQVLVRGDDRAFFEEGFVFADSNYFRFFQTGLLSGNPRTALADPFSVVLTETMAHKYFGSQDPVGKTLSVRLRGDGTSFEYTVSGVAHSLPPETHFHFDFLASYRQHPFATNNDGTERADWTGQDVYTYVKLVPGGEPDALEAKLPHVVDQYVIPFLRDQTNGAATNEPRAARYRFFLQPLREIHLGSGLRNEFEPVGSEETVGILQLVAFIILIIAGINFINLSTARATRRAREVGVRKALGSDRRQLAAQFLVESLILSLLAFSTALLLAQMAMPWFDRLTGKSFHSVLSEGSGLLLFMLGLCAAVGMLSGAWPALHLASFSMVRVLRGSIMSTNAGQRRMRALLVWLQFFVATAMIVGSVVVFLQMRFVSRSSLGFDREQLVVIGETHVLRERIESFREAIEQVPGVIRAATSESVPGRVVGESVFSINSEAGKREIMTGRVYAGFGFLETLGVRLVEGRAPSSRFATDSTAAVLNQAAVRALGIIEPVGKQLVREGNGLRYTIVGVVEDYHFDSLHRQIGPLAIFGPDPYYENRPRQVVLARLSPGAVASAVDELERTWKSFVPGQPFRFSFVDEEVDALYRTDRDAQRMLGVFCGLAVLVACLGLFGLATYSAAQRRMEIGVRKALGASSVRIGLLLLGELSRPVALAFALAAPISYLAARSWLDDFAYRTDATWQVFFLTAAILSLATALSIGFQTARAANSDPVSCLKDE